MPEQQQQQQQPEVIASAVVAGLVTRQLRALIWSSSNVGALAGIPSMPSMLMNYAYTPPWDRTAGAWMAWLFGAVQAALLVHVLQSLAAGFTSTRVIGVTRSVARLGSLVGCQLTLKVDLRSRLAAEQLAHEYMTSILEYPGCCSCAVVVDS